MKALIKTPIGSILAIANDKALLSLEFVQQAESTGRNALIDLIEKELTLYFAGKLQKFTTPIAPIGTPFQKQVWNALQSIPYGETRSYAEIAQAIGRPTAFRAVAQANGANPLGIIIPCHRVINTNGKLGGYSGGVDKKEWLLHLERGKSAINRLS